MEEQIKEVISKISEDLKSMAKEHGALIVMVLVGLYLWKILKK